MTQDVYTVTSIMQGVGVAGVLMEVGNLDLYTACIQKSKGSHYSITLMYVRKDQHPGNVSVLGIVQWLVKGGSPLLSETT